MRLASYLWDGRPSYGIVTPTGIADLGSLQGDRFPTLRTFLSERTHRITAEDISARIPLEHVTFLPVIPDAGAIFCVGLNYADHARETGRPLPKHPSTFLKLARSLVGHQATLQRPRASGQLDWEAELAVVIGRRARHVPENDAMWYVAGYTCLNDGSIRDWQLERDLTQGKNFFASGACGPWLVTTDEVDNLDELEISCRVNGRLMQHALTSNLIFSVHQLVSYYSTITELQPGDIISTGTPAGVGHRRDPKIFLSPGDVVEVEIGGIGTLRNTVVDE